ncbi:MAG TPA: DUF5132 domain-containing protein [Bryobacteraceae bacterium]|nr:DUF5132 domain-containing protein [Bryobacteraceae bacterium]
MSEKSKAVLDETNVVAVADEVESRLRQNPPAARRVTPAAEQNERHGGRKVFFLGAASGLAFALVAPLFSKQARPAVRGAIKGGILAGRYVKRVASSVKEDVQDIAAEAQADLDAEKTPGEAGAV